MLYVLCAFGVKFCINVCVVRFQEIKELEGEIEKWKGQIEKAMRNDEDTSPKSEASSTGGLKEKLLLVGGLTTTAVCGLLAAKETNTTKQAALTGAAVCASTIAYVSQSRKQRAHFRNSILETTQRSQEDPLDLRLKQLEVAEKERQLEKARKESN